MKIGLTKRFWLRTAGIAVAVFTLYWLLLCSPQPFLQASNLALYSDQPFAPEAGQRVLETVEANLAASPLYSSNDRHAAFICNARWRQRLFFNRKYGVSGLNQYPSTTNVFLREATAGLWAQLARTRGYQLGPLTRSKSAQPCSSTRLVA